MGNLTPCCGDDARLVLAHVERTFPGCLRAPRGGLGHPYVDPGAGYREILWDWDAYFCLVGLQRWAGAVGPAAVGCVQNFLAHQRPDGSLPYTLTPHAVRSDQPRDGASAANSAKPLLAQFAELAARYAGEAVWLGAAYPGLAAHVRHWEATQQSRLGLFTFRSHRGSGTDDHPAVYGRPLNSSADVFLNSLMVAEYQALSRLAHAAGLPAEAADWTRRAQALADRLRTAMWDPIDGCYYNLDVSLHIPGTTNQEVTWVTPLKFRSWTAVMPLWAGIAPPEHAERFIREHLLNPAEYRAPHGIRSLARSEPAYEIAIGSNPSCWRGPVWVVANYLAWCALRTYGYARAAADLARDLLAMLAADLRAHGQMHEYYHPETGAGLTHPGFLNWNTLACVMADDDVP